MSPKLSVYNELFCCYRVSLKSETFASKPYEMHISFSIVSVLNIFQYLYGEVIVFFITVKTSIHYEYPLSILASHPCLENDLLFSTLEQSQPCLLSLPARIFPTQGEFPGVLLA